MSQPPEDKPFDLTNIPRGAIGLKGVPVNRNARLPSIRSPRDLTLGTPAKRTFVPNIPARREKKKPEPNNNLSNQGNSSNQSKRAIPNIPERGRGRGRNKPQIIQTEGAVFGDGVSMSSAKGRSKESAQKSSYSSGGGGGRGSSAYKIEKLQKSKADISIDINLMRDDFIDDGEDESTGIKPVVFPLEVKKKEENLELKKEICDSKEPFNNQNFAKEMGFDVQKIAKFIKKEKDDSPKSLQLPANFPMNEITDVLTSEKLQLVLFQFPKCITAPVRTDKHQKLQSITESTSNEQKTLSSLPDGQLGKLQIMKSGRVRLKVGELYFNLDNTTKLASRHEVVSIQTDGTTADISMLGNVLQSFSLVPDVDNLLKK